MPTEATLQIFEQRIIARCVEWGLDWHPMGGRLAGLDLVARLQHHGVPTRLIDVTSLPYVALWFAVSEQQHWGVDGKIFVWDAEGLVLPYGWAHAPELPWKSAGPDWAGRAYIWQPPPLDDRIKRQAGWFIFGGIPRVEEVSIETDSVLINVYEYDFLRSGSVRRGRGRTNSFVTVASSSKSEIPRQLDTYLGISAQTLFPDADGFRSFGMDHVAETPSDLRPPSNIHIRLLGRPWEYSDTATALLLNTELQKSPDVYAHLKAIVRRDDRFVVEISERVAQEDFQEVSSRIASTGRSAEFPYQVDFLIVD